MLDPEVIRGDFPIFHNGGEKLVYLDNAASTQKPAAVINALTDFYRTSYANVHRSPHALGIRATELYEGARARLARFVGAAEPAELVFTRGTTEAINLVAGLLAGQMLKSGDVILTTISEHHSNLVPWQMAAERSGAQLRFVNLHGSGQFDLDEIIRHWHPRTRVFAFQHASNVLGAIHPVKELCNIASNRGALTIVDGAQAVPHLKVDVRELGCDFYAFSGHKMCAPSGIGALFGRRELWERFQPLFGGGEMIKRVTLEGAEWNDVPYKFEAGTPNIEGAIGLGVAVDYLESLGMAEIESYVGSLAAQAYDTLAAIPGVTLFGPRQPRTGALSFWVDGVHPHDLASFFDQDGIAIRAGHHCAEPLMNWLQLPATARASFYFYNTPAEIDRLAAALHYARKVMGCVA